jgi:hypothetical protein
LATIKHFLFFSFILFSAAGNYAQILCRDRTPPVKGTIGSNLETFKMYSRSYGLLAGIQKGKYTFLELGVEQHWRKIKLVKPRLTSIGLNMEYNFRYNVLGYRAAVWTKRGRVDLTYGLGFCYLTDFDRSRWAISPMLGFRLLGFHLVNGYNFIPDKGDFNRVNTLFISLRYFLSKDTKIKFRKSK